MYHEDEIMKWHSMRYHTKLVEIAAYVAWIFEYGMPNVLHATPLVLDYSRPLGNIDTIKEFTDILVPHSAATLDGCG